jgi:acetyl esterase/lipase
VIYGRKYGTALTLDVLIPKEKANGAGIIRVVSGGWYSDHAGVDPAYMAEFLRRGYTVFAVVHGSQPKYTIPEVLEDMNRAVRFIRHNAAKWHVDPNRLGIVGGSAGGHLSLMIAMSGKPGAADAKDPVDRESSRVQAVACFFPPTDFLNYGKPNRDILEALEAELADFKAPFEFRELDPKTHQLKYIQSRQRRLEIAKQISPITFVTPDDPPTLIFHGDVDKLVPLQQSREMEEKLQEAHVPVKLVVKPGAGHGWPELVSQDIPVIADWFDQYLLKKPPSTPAQ